MANKTTDAIAQKFVEAQTKSEIDEIFKEHCQQYGGHSQLSLIARKVQSLLDDRIDPDLMAELESESGKASQQVHYAEFLLRTRARQLRKAVDTKKSVKRENDQSEGKERDPLDFMRLHNFAANLLANGDWRAKTIAVRLFTGRRAGEILYRSNFSEHSEYSVKVTYLSKVPAEQQTLSAIVPTLIPAVDVVRLISEIREEWHTKIEDAWKVYLDTLEEKGRTEAGESIKSRIQNPVVEFFNTQVRPLFPELSQEESEQEGAHSLRGVYGCVLYRLMGGHDSQYSEEYMQRALVHVSGATTSAYRRYRLFNFEPLIADDQHPGIKSMLKLKEIGWMEDSTPIVGFTIDALTGQIADETLAGRILQKIGSNDPDELGRFLGSLIQQGWEAQKSVTAKPEPKTATVQSTSQKASTESPSAQKIQQIVDAIFLVNEMTGGNPELYPTTPLIQSIYKRLHDKMPNLATCRAVLDQDVNADRIRGLSVANNRHISTDKMNEMIEEVVAQHGQPV